ncbi:MAG TPA: nitroreductase family protein [Aliidongia sp.]|uniref:nitroreductase family protein n=1 Tax=Aliidongia sp. TaxID=1914230 RepID=UPI002DDD53E3|nr:nitroreductase family protein [Aliidongia sp.]HEV2674551.1 nitroreductase family protein [Aliidongia sp.]
MIDDLGAAVSELLRSHRSIRRFKTDPIAPALIERICDDAIRGSSSSGNLNSFALVLTEDPARKDHLCALHYDQPMIRQAPLLITFCADVHRTRRWLALRDARDNFNNLQGFLVAAFDAIILAQSVALGCEAHGLGICYLGTTVDAATEIAKYLELPETCVPVTSLVVGYPDEAPAARDRLALGAYLHRERYRPPADEDLLGLYADREIKGWQRYQALGPGMAQQMADHGITSLAQFYTSDLKYTPSRCEATSEQFSQLLIDSGYTDRLRATARRRED